MVSFITDKYDINHREKETKDMLYNQLKSLVNARIENDFHKIKVKIGFSNLSYY